MSSRHSVYIPHKVKFVNCKGTLIEPKENYGIWAHWDYLKSGWISSPVSKEDLSKWKKSLEEMNFPGFLFEKELLKALKWFKDKEI
uniref:Uncharacterized protein n=1 Tax=Rhizobium phage IG49 TaxID=3129228 RepID=A0AAU8HYM1_9CAUD